MSKKTKRNTAEIKVEVPTYDLHDASQDPPDQEVTEMLEEMFAKRAQQKQAEAENTRSLTESLDTEAKLLCDLIGKARLKDPQIGAKICAGLDAAAKGDKHPMYDAMIDLMEAGGRSPKQIADFRLLVAQSHAIDAAGA